MGQYISLRTSSVLILAAAVFCHGNCRTACGIESSSVVLTYELTPEVTPSGDDVNGDIHDCINVLNGMMRDCGRAEVVADNRFEVEIDKQANPKALGQIKLILSAKSRLEFHLLADRTWKSDQTIIEFAKTLPPSQKVVKRGGMLVGEWVAYSVKQFGQPSDEKYGMVTRVANNVPETLVLTDRWNITGKHLRSVDMGLDKGTPLILVEFNERGARRINGLTTRYLANSDGTERYRSLAVVLDKRLLVAPTIKTAISDRASMSGGTLSEKEVWQTVQLMQIGLLPSCTLVNEK